MTMIMNQGIIADTDWFLHVERRRRIAYLPDAVAFMEKHGPKEPFLRWGELLPVEEHVARGVAAKMEQDTL